MGTTYFEGILKFKTVLTLYLKKKKTVLTFDHLN